MFMTLIIFIAIVIAGSVAINANGKIDQLAARVRKLERQMSASQADPASPDDLASASEPGSETPAS